MQNSPPKLRRQTHPRETGIALVTVLIMIVLVAVLVSITSILAIGNGRSSTDTLLGSKAQYAAEAGMENAIYQVFYKTKAAWQASTDSTVVNGLEPKFDACTFKKWSTGKWKIPDDINEVKAAKNNNEACSYTTAPATVTAPSFPNLYNNASVHPTTAEASQGLYPNLTKTLETSGTDITGYKSTLKREDISGSDDVNITITTTGYVSQAGKEVATRSLQQTVKITSTLYQGDRFALLTNATNCSLCHLHIDTMQRVYADPASTEVYSRARIAVLNESLNLDPAHDGDTFIAGTIYARKTVTSTTAKEVYAPKWAKDANGNLIEGFLKAGPTFGTTGIRGKPFGNAVSGDKELDAGVIDAASESVYSTYGTKGTKTKNGKIYQNYPTEAGLKDAKYGGEWPDGAVPDAFPTVIPEFSTSKDGLISDAEWAAYTSSAQRGSLSTDENGDGVADTLGVVYGVRRPSSSSVVDPNVVNAPISFDPTLASASLYATTLEGQGLAQNDATFLTVTLPTFLTNMRNNNTAGINTFVTNYKGWLLQQALASPNNRDLQPGASNFGVVGASSISWPPVNGSARNNFWVKLDTTTTGTPTLTLRYRDTGSGLWTDCAAQNATCSFPGTGSVRFGNANTASWKVSSKVKSIACTTTAFGLDPAPGVTQTCERSTTATTAGPWVFCSNVGGATCTLATTTYYRIGTASASIWSTPQTSTSSIACNTATFGDPWPNVTKKCQVNETTTERVISLPITQADVFPAISNSAALSLQTGYWDGNVIIDAGRVSDSGSSRKTVTINGPVYVNGDVVIRGQVKGRGKIIARGNIYVVGDLVYGCGDHACRITDSAGLASYRNWQQLPLLGLLAGQNVLIGDFDFPDYRATNDAVNRSGGVFDLVNDQVGRDTGNSTSQGVAGLPGGTTNSWPYYSVPGSTGANSSNFSGTGDMGFVPMSAASANGKNCPSNVCGTATTNRYFQAGPFNQLVRRPASSFGSYENGGGQINAIGNATVIPLYTSNGPMQVGGNNGRKGFYALPGSTGSQIATGLSCSSNTSNTINNVTSVTAKRFGGGTVNYNFGFYCPPNTSGAGSFLRTWTYGTTDPGQDANAWMSQSPQSKALDGGAGMTTGWLGGLLAQDSTGNFRQTGDLSQTRLLKMMWLTTMEHARDLDPVAPGNQAGPLRTDGIFYSTHSIFALTRSYRNTWQDARSQTEGRWIHNGSVVSAELGFLITGDYTSAANGANTRFASNRKSPIDYRPSSSIVAADAGLDDPDWTTAPSFSTSLNLGPAMGIFYDERLAGFLGIQNNNAVQLQRSRGYTQVPK